MITKVIIIILFIRCFFFQDEKGLPYVLPIVRKVEQEILNEKTHNHEYMPFLGNPSINDAVIKLLLGKGCEAVTSGRAFSVQSIAGTGALRLGAEYLKQQGFDFVCYSDPTWINHRDIFLKAGFKDVQPYPYWKYEEQRLDFDSLLDFMNQSLR